MPKKSVGIITLQGDNYGATLQAVALNRKLNCIGYNAENLNYNDKRRVVRQLSLKSKIGYFVRRKIITPILIGKSKEKKFRLFREKFLRLSKQKWDTKEKLQKKPPEYDVYVSGSDQIWNPDVIGDDYNYLLSFVNDGKRKIAYASSFGKSKIDEDKKQKYKQYLSRYDCIGVREQSGSILAEELTNRHCETVLDPTLLLSSEEWKELASEEKENSSYVLCYYMPGDDIVCKTIKKIAEDISKETGAKIVSLGLKEHLRFKREFNLNATAGPGEFLSLFLHADYVVTNSFHGTAFATNFNKQLFVPINLDLDSKKARHARMIDYLKMLELEEAIVPIIKGEYSVREGFLDYEKTKLILEKKREESIRYLIDAIEGRK